MTKTSTTDEYEPSLGQFLIYVAWRTGRSLESAVLCVLGVCAVSAIRRG